MSAPSTTPQTSLNSHPKIKFNIGDKAYCFNIGMQNPLVSELLIKGVLNNDQGNFYTHDTKMWFPENHLFMNKKEAYKALIQQAESEMTQ